MSIQIQKINVKVGPWFDVRTEYSGLDFEIRLEFCRELTIEMLNQVDLLEYYTNRSPLKLNGEGNDKAGQGDAHLCNFIVEH